MKWTKWSGMRWSEVQYREGGGVFMEKVYRTGKWWEVMECVESVSEWMIGGETYKKLYTALSYLDVFTFYTCILICLMRIVVSFKLSCVWLLLIGRVYCCSCLVCIFVILCVFVVLFAHCLFFFYFRCRTAG